MSAIEVLYEDNHLIAINKRSGDIVQGDKTGDTSLCDKVKDYLKESYQKPGNVFCGVIHRIDRPVSGVVLFAKTSKALSRMNVMIQNRDIHKLYWAIVKQSPPAPHAFLIHYLKKNEKNNKVFVLSTPKKGYLKAEMEYTYIMSSQQYHLLEVILKTGRHHQIRAQLSAINCPIKGDLKYGYSRSNPDASISLHARKINFIHPVSREEISITAPVPEDNLWLFFEENSNNK